jgi:hypothetical protein
MRAYYGLRPGDKVVLWIDGRSMFVQPVHTLPPHPRMSYEQAAATLRAFCRAYGKDFAPSLLPPDVLDAARHYHLLG